MTRARSFLDGLTGPALIVTQGITLRMLRRIAMSWDQSRTSDLRPHQGAVHAVRSASHAICCRG